MASGIKANFGTMTKPFHVGHTTRNGLLAALLAKEGMTANAGALEHPQGFFAVYNGAGNFNAERLLDHWGDPFDLVDPGIAFKRHPCCGSTHPAVDAMLHLREAHGLSPERVAKVESWTHPRRLRHTNRPDPQSGLDGKFSIQYVLARALMHGIVSMEHFSDEAVRDPATRALMTRVHAAPRSRSEARDQRSFLLPPEDHDHGRRDLRAFRRPPGRPRPRSSAAAGRAGSEIPRLCEDRARREGGRNGARRGVMRLRRAGRVRRARRHRGRRQAAGGRNAQPRLCMT